MLKYHIIRNKIDGRQAMAGYGFGTSQIYNIYTLVLGVFAKTNPQLDFNLKPILKLESNAKLT